ncbi:hypothetical protein INR49_011344 [Caranx melampygus]|nr:hypothetical protein INR49_011344 [Caranx melampygus]
MNTWCEEELHSLLRWLVTAECLSGSDGGPTSLFRKYYIVPNMFYQPFSSSIVFYFLYYQKRSFDFPACVGPLPGEVLLCIRTALFRCLWSWPPHHGGSPPARRPCVAAPVPLPSLTGFSWWTAPACSTSLIISQEIGHYSEVLQNHNVTPATSLHPLILTPPSLHFFRVFQSESTVTSFICQHQEEIRIALEKGNRQRGGGREERVVTAADTEHWDGHLICIPQWFVPLPVAVPVLGWVSPLAQCPGHWRTRGSLLRLGRGAEKTFLKVPEGRRAEGPIHIQDCSEGTCVP